VIGIKSKLKKSAAWVLKRPYEGLSGQSSSRREESEAATIRAGFD